MVEGPYDPAKDARRVWRDQVEMYRRTWSTGVNSDSITGEARIYSANQDALRLLDAWVKAPGHFENWSKFVAQKGPKPPTGAPVDPATGLPAGASLDPQRFQQLRSELLTQPLPSMQFLVQWGIANGVRFDADKVLEDPRYNPYGQSQPGNGNASAPSQPLLTYDPDDELDRVVAHLWEQRYPDRPLTPKAQIKAATQAGEGTSGSGGTVRRL